MPEPNKLYIVLWAISTWFKMGVLETQFKNKYTVCSTPHITATFE